MNKAEIGLAVSTLALFAAACGSTSEAQSAPATAEPTKEEQQEAKIREAIEGLPGPAIILEDPKELKVDRSQVGADDHGSPVGDAIKDGGLITVGDFTFQIDYDTPAFAENTMTYILDNPADENVLAEHIGVGYYHKVQEEISLFLSAKTYPSNEFNTVSLMPGDMILVVPIRVEGLYSPAPDWWVDDDGDLLIGPDGKPQWANQRTPIPMANSVSGNTDGGIALAVLKVTGEENGVIQVQMQGVANLAGKDVFTMPDPDVPETQLQVHPGETTQTN